MRHLIIGTGIAGISAAETIRGNRPEDEIILLGNEPGLPYWRASLSRCIMNVIPRQKMGLKPEGWFKQQHIHLEHGQAQRIDPTDKQVTYLQGEAEKQIGFDRLCIATGADPITLNVPGADLPEILTFRNLADSERMQILLEKTRHVLVVGGGVLGMELVEIAQDKKTECTIIQRSDRLGVPLVDETGSRILLRRVTGEDGVHSWGAKVVFNDEVEAFLVTEGHLSGARLKSGRHIECDAAVICIGITADPALFEGSGLRFERGLVVDEHQESSIPAIYGAGDCVVYPSESGRLVPTRTWVSSRIQGKTAGFNMCEIPCLLFDEGPMYNASYLYDLRYMILGEFDASGGPYQSISCQPDDSSYRKLVFKEHRLVGAATLGNRHGDQAIRRLIAQKIEIADNDDKQKLLDTTFDPNLFATRGVEYIMY